jgi:hypothetical protein
MAVAIEFANVIVRRAAVERAFPGGLDGFARQDLANLTEDDYLLRVGFISTREADNFAAALEAAGLKAKDDLAVIRSVGEPPPWLSVGEIDGRIACWLSGHPPGAVAQAEPGFLVRCASADSGWLAEVARSCGVELAESAQGPAPGEPRRLMCLRGDAEIVLEIFQGKERDVLWIRRQPARRRQLRDDIALLQALKSCLLQAGAKELDGPR